MVTPTVIELLRQLAHEAEQNAARFDARAEALRIEADRAQGEGEAASASAVRLHRLADRLSRQPENAIGTITWREKLWNVVPQTRMTAEEVAEALGWSKSAVYHRLRPDAAHGAIPHRKTDTGALVFLAGEVRTWFMQTETVIQAGAFETVAAQRYRRRRHA